MKGPCPGGENCQCLYTDKGRIDPWELKNNTGGVMGEKEMKVSRHLWRDKGTIEFNDFSINLYDRQMYQLRNLLLDLYPMEKKSDRQEEVKEKLNLYMDVRDYICPNCGYKKGNETIEDHDKKKKAFGPLSDRQEEVVDLIGNIENFYWDSKKGPPQNLYNIMTDLKERVAAIIDRRIEEIQMSDYIAVLWTKGERIKTCDELKNLRSQLVGKKGEKNGHDDETNSD